MDVLTGLLETVRSKQLSRGNFLGLLNVLIARRLAKTGAEQIIGGMTFRDLASLLKKVRWDPDDVRELGIDPATLPVRDRQRYWFSAICQANVGSDDAMARGEALAVRLREEGYDVGPPPGHGRTA